MPPTISRSSSRSALPTPPRTVTRRKPRRSLHHSSDEDVDNDDDVLPTDDVLLEESKRSKKRRRLYTVSEDGPLHEEQEQDAFWMSGHQGPVNATHHDPDTDPERGEEDEEEEQGLLLRGLGRTAQKEKERLRLESEQQKFGARSSTGSPASSALASPPPSNRKKVQPKRRIKHSALQLGPALPSSSSLSPSPSPYATRSQSKAVVLSVLPAKPTLDSVHNPFLDSPGDPVPDSPEGADGVDTMGVDEGKETIPRREKPTVTWVQCVFLCLLDLGQCF